MGTTNTTITILQSSQFKWPFQVQYMESLETRDQAIRYAGQRGCNLIVQYSRRPGPQFDVLLDPENVCTSRADSEVIQIEVDQLKDAQSSGGHSRSAFSGVAKLIRRFSGSARRPAPSGESSLQPAR
ncbi:MAG TPA: hypothetical protein VFZ27_16005 [Terriglobia bacterium]|nr:hypothetical protein [Terriglobia bacterium]